MQRVMTQSTADQVHCRPKLPQTDCKDVGLGGWGGMRGPRGAGEYGVHAGSNTKSVGTKELLST